MHDTFVTGGLPGVAVGGRAFMCSGGDVTYFQESAQNKAEWAK